MKVLGSAVLTMEVFVMGFAMLIAKDIHEPATIIYGFAFMLVTIATVRLLKKRIGWIIGSILQFALMAYSVVVPAMAIVNLIFMARIEAKGYVIADLKMMQADRALLERHYAEHQGKPFFEPLVEFMLSGPIVAIIAEGQRVIEGFRSLAGATDPTVAAPGTIRGDLARDQGTKVQQNLVHGSDSPDSAAREIAIFFEGK
jgi:nucleoside-diphosphate kinase